MTTAFGWKIGAGLVATLFAGWAATEFATRYNAMQLAQEYGHVCKGAANASEIRITTVEGAQLFNCDSQTAGNGKVCYLQMWVTPLYLATPARMEQMTTRAVGGQSTVAD